MDRYISAKELGELLSVSSRVIAYWARRGLIPGAIKVGKEWRFRVSDVNNWLAKQHIWQASAEVYEWPHSTPDQVPPTTGRGSRLPERRTDAVREKPIYERLNLKQNG